MHTMADSLDVLRAQMAARLALDPDDVYARAVLDALDPDGP